MSPVVRLRCGTRGISRDPAAEGRTPARPDAAGSHGRAPLQAAWDRLADEVARRAERFLPDEFFAGAPFERVVVHLRPGARRAGSRPGVPPMWLAGRQLEIRVPVPARLLREPPSLETRIHLEEALLDALLVIAGRFARPSAELACARHLAALAGVAAPG
jgi:hypothetical protein